MTTDLTEEEMRRALFGSPTPAPQVAAPTTPLPTQEILSAPPAKPLAKNKAAKAFTPSLRVTMRVTNEFEGKTYELIHDADTLHSKSPADTSFAMCLGRSMNSGRLGSKSYQRQQSVAADRFQPKAAGHGRF